ncbi:MAG: hypothetical protein KJ990_03350 [Proteobacteria bacterium]|nr:hypothetical protein [Pseudomonadota bacterium]MBU1649559.1 hypothetical protein [Pseudomonadota bacterium]MBU1985720.1 hypothetical protein [Pseudomonadota bacterium]
MKKIIMIAIFASLIISAGCSSEEPKEQPVKDSTNQAIQAAADKAHEVIDKTATASKSIVEKAEEIKDAARKAASDMSASIQKDNEQVKEKTTTPQEAPAPADSHK